jgi:hypothetical protein
MSSQPTVSKNLYLNSASLAPIPQSSINGPFSANYAVGTWIFVNTFRTSGSPFLMYGNSQNNGTSGKPWLFSMRFDQTKPTLYADIAVGTGAANTTVTTTVSENFPIQSWTYVVVSVANSYVDVYMNGKMVRSQKLTQQPMSNSADDSPTFSFGQSDIYLSNLNRWNKPLDPQTIWTYYQKGNGNPDTGSSGAYHLSLNLAKDTNNYVYRLF